MKRSHQKWRQDKRRNRVGISIITAVAIMMLVTSGVRVVFADQDIKGMLVHWFNKETTTAITEIDEAVTDEQYKQTQRLQSEIQNSIEQTEADLKVYKNKLKDDAIEEIKRYADKLAEDINAGSTSDEAYAQKLEQIVTSAVAELNGVQYEPQNQPDEESHEETDIVENEGTENEGTENEVPSQETDSETSSQKAEKGHSGSANSNTPQNQSESGSDNNDIDKKRADDINP